MIYTGNKNIMEDNLENIEDKKKEILVHRYLYYVLNEPIISDYEYDTLEKNYLKNNSNDADITKPGSSLSSSYSQEIINLSNKKVATKK